MLLTPEQVQELTGRKRPGWQARVLEHMGIPFRRRPDGTLAVLTIHVETIPGQQPARLAAGPKLRLEA